MPDLNLDEIEQNLNDEDYCHDMTAYEWDQLVRSLVAEVKRLRKYADDCIDDIAGYEAAQAKLDARKRKGISDCRRNPRPENQQGEQL